MSGIIEQFSFSATITGPICLMLLLGVLLRKWKLIDDHFINIASKLVFQVTLPALLFLSIIKSDTISSDSIPLVGFGVIANTLFFLFATVVTKAIIKQPAQQGVIIQGAFRSNTGIIGLAYVANAYGEQGVALAAVYVAAVTVLYNILAVIALAPKNQDSSSQAFKAMMKSITKNPLIISIILAFIVYSLSIPVPNVVIHAGEYFADMTLPLALLCTGGSLDVGQLRHNKAPNILSSTLKLIACPILLTLGAYFCGFTGMSLGIIFFMTSSPAAAASYVMARAMGGDATLAANIIALTTVGSVITCTLGIVILSSLNLM